METIRPVPGYNVRTFRTLQYELHIPLIERTKHKYKLSIEQWPLYAVHFSFRDSSKSSIAGHRVVSKRH